MGTPTGEARREYVPGRGRRRGWPRRAGGQSLLELALVLPLVLFFILAVIQAAVIYRAYLDLVSVTRDTARWVSVHAQVLDSATIATVTASGRLPSSINPARLTLAFNPQCTAISSGKCTTPVPRNVGDPLTVTATYDTTDIRFLPSTIGSGSWVFVMPATTITYSMTLQVEPT